jgi:hypothetical protein
LSVFDKYKNYFKSDSNSCSFFERWEIGSFAKLWLWIGLCGFANVPMCGWLKLFFKMCGGENF